MVRVIKRINTSTSPVLVDTDAGQGFLKAIGNPEGNGCLVAEYVGTRLAEWFGLPTFDYAIIEVTRDDEIPVGDKIADPGPAFITKKENGDTWSGEAKQLKHLTNLEVLPRLVTFDTWTLNCDRYSVQDRDGIQRIRCNYRNVFLSTESSDPGKLAVRAMDHTHCFACGRELSKRLGHLDTIRDQRVFGAFPQFRPYLDRDAIRAASDSLRSLEVGWVGELLAAVPSEWQLDASSRDALRDLIVRRAEFVADSIEGKLFPQQSFSLGSSDEEDQ